MVAYAHGAILACDDLRLPEQFVAAGNTVHVAANGFTNWHGFAVAIINGLKARGAAVKAERVVPIQSADYQANRAIRPRNSRLDVGRLARVFGITLPHWATALEPEIDQLARRLN